MNRLELRAIRERYGYSLRQVANAADMSHPYLQQLENGTKPLKPELQARILNALYTLAEKDARGKR